VIRLDEEGTEGAAMPEGGIVSELEAAAALFQEGKLTQPEYEAVKRRLLEGTPAPPPEAAQSRSPSTQPSGVVYVDSSEARETVARGNRWGWVFLGGGVVLVALRVLLELS